MNYLVEANKIKIINKKNIEKAKKLLIGCKNCSCDICTEATKILRSIR